MFIIEIALSARASIPDFNRLVFQFDRLAGRLSSIPLAFFFILINAHVF